MNCDQCGHGEDDHEAGVGPCSAMLFDEDGADYDCDCIAFELWEEDAPDS